MRTAYVNGRWPLKLPEHRAQFHEERPWWEAARLADMHAWAFRNGVRDVRHLWERATLIDVGSEEGDLTTLFASWGLTVPFIDPSKPWVSQTIDTMSANEIPFAASFIGFAGPEDQLEGATWDGTGFARLDERPDLKRITLDTFAGLIDTKVDAVTMDVEGDELQVLEGAPGLLTEDIVWWVSIHGDVDPHANTPSQVHKVMRGYGYDDQFLAYDHEWHYRFFRPF